MSTIKFFKTLTKNDTGETHSHQSGITIPKLVADSGIFPDLGVAILNPRVEICFYDNDGNMWKFQYIYYNDVYHGKPKKLAHDEHRLTCTKDYIRSNSIKSGDSIWFSIDEDGVRRIGFTKVEDDNNKQPEEITVIKLKSGWRCIKA